MSNSYIKFRYFHKPLGLSPLQEALNSSALAGMPRVERLLSSLRITINLDKACAFRITNEEVSAIDSQVVRLMRMIQLGKVECLAGRSSPYEQVKLYA